VSSDEYEGIRITPCWLIEGMVRGLILDPLALVLGPLTDRKPDKESK
jgi:hypothetical protein